MKRPAHAENTLAAHQGLARGVPEPRHSQHVHRRLSGRDGSGVRGAARLAARKRSSIAWAASSTRPWKAPRPTRLPDHVPPEVQEERYERFMELAGEISAERLAQQVGKRMRVLVDSVADGVAIARSEGDAPEIDGVVHIEKCRAGCKSGDWAEVEITSADDYDLHAKLANAASASSGGRSPPSLSPTDPSATTATPASSESSPPSRSAGRPLRHRLEFPAREVIELARQQSVAPHEIFAQLGELHAAAALAAHARRRDR